MVRNLIILIAITFGLAGCQSKTNQEEVDRRKKEAEFDATSEALQEKFGEVLGTMSRTELSAVLQSVGADYDPSFVNDPNNAESYLIRDGKAASNLGIYYVDLMYTAAYENRDLTVALFGSAQTLASKLGTERSLNQTVLDKLGDEMEENNKKALEDALKDASTYLNNNNRPRVAGVVVLGIIVERLHIFSLIIDQALEKEGLSPEEISLLTTPIMKAAYAQGSSVDLLAQYLATVREQDDPILIFSYIRELQGEFQSITDMTIDFDRTQTIDPKVLDGLFQVANEMRALIVDPTSD